MKESEAEKLSEQIAKLGKFGDTCKLDKSLWIDWPDEHGYYWLAEINNDDIPSLVLVHYFSHGGDFEVYEFEAEQATPSEAYNHPHYRWMGPIRIPERPKA